MFQDNLKALRKEKGITQEELAARLNVVRQTVSKWEKGLSVPDSDLLIKLAEILDVPVSRRFGRAAFADQRAAGYQKQTGEESMESIRLYYRRHYCDVHPGHNCFYRSHCSSSPVQYRRNFTSHCWNGNRYLKT